MALTALLARHAESDWNATGRWQGHADRPLTARGREQAARLANQLLPARLTAVYSSDLTRARETATAVARPKGLTVSTLQALREVDVGSWSGLTSEQAAARFPVGHARWQAGGVGWDDGESYADLGRRVLAALAEIASAHPVGRILVVSHGGPIRVVHAAALGLDLASYRRRFPVEPNARLSAVTLEDGRPSELFRAEAVDDLLVEETTPTAGRRPSPQRSAG